jgi:hypothetical protein
MAPGKGASTGTSTGSGASTGTSTGSGAPTPKGTKAGTTLRFPQLSKTKLEGILIIMFLATFIYMIVSISALISFNKNDIKINSDGTYECYSGCGKRSGKINNYTGERYGDMPLIGVVTLKTACLWTFVPFVSVCFTIFCVYKLSKLTKSVNPYIT